MMARKKNRKINTWMDRWTGTSINRPMDGFSARQIDS